RQKLRERARRNRMTGERRTVALPPTPLSPGTLGGPSRGLRPSDAFDAHGDVVRAALADRDEIERLLSTMPKADRERLPDVVPSANALAAKVQALASTVSELDRNSSAGAAEPVEREISRLEAEANPLDRVASEERVKRLA